VFDCAHERELSRREFSEEVLGFLKREKMSPGEMKH